MSTFPTRTTETGVTVVSLTGRVTMATAPQLRADLRELVETGVKYVVIDLGGVDFIDSSALGALVSGLKAAREAGGDLRIVGPKEQVMDILEATNLLRILVPHESADTAFADLQ